MLNQAMLVRKTILLRRVYKHLARLLTVSQSMQPTRPSLKLAVAGRDIFSQCYLNAAQPKVTDGRYYLVATPGICNMIQ